MIRKEEAAVKTDPLAVVLLAAGAGRRFEGDKLFYSIDGIPMYRRAAGLVSGLGDEAAVKIVVTGDERIASDLEKSGFTVVWNREPERGISRSAALGVEAAEMAGAGAVCFLVCDQPWLRRETRAGFLAAWKTSRKSMGSLTFHGRAGNPAVFGKTWWEELKQLSGDRGGRQVLNRHPEEVFFYEAAEERELEDVDRKPGM